MMVVVVVVVVHRWWMIGVKLVITSHKKGDF
jgi:hypothetical protein